MEQRYGYKHLVLLGLSASSPSSVMEGLTKYKYI